MAKQVINVGSAANDGTGDTLRAAAQKINSNFTEVYGTAQAAFDAANSVSFHSSSIANGEFQVTLNGDNGNLTVPGTISGPEVTTTWTDTITAINLGTDTIVTFTNSHFGGPSSGQMVISGVNGTTQINRTWYYQAWDNNQIKLFNDASINDAVDSTAWTTYVDGGAGENIVGGGVSIEANYNTWDFNADGNLYSPGNVVIGGGNNSNGNEQHLIIDSSNYWTSIQWKNFDSPQDPGNTPFECQAQLLRVFATDATVTSWCNVNNPREELVALTAIRPNGTSYNGLMLSTSDGKIPDAPYNDGTGTRHDWILHGDGTMKFPYQPTDGRTGSGEALLFNQSESQKVIGTKNGTDTHPTVERIVIAGGDGYGSGEGGDIYLWAGRSATDTNGAGNGGGDIKVDAGDGYDVSGGTIKIRGGNSQVGSEGIAGQGGWIQIDGGSTWNGGDAGDITLNAGSAYNGGTDAKLRVTTSKGSQVWDFGSDGLTHLPNGIRFPGNYVDITTSSEGTNNKDIDLYTNEWAGGGVEVYLQHDNAVSLLTDNGNYEWKFDKTGNMILPRTNNITTPPTVISGPTGTEYTGLTYNSVGNGTPYQYVIIGTNAAFDNWFNLGADIVGYKVFTTGNPSSMVTVLNNLQQTLGGPSIEFDGPVPASPWTVQSSDFTPAVLQQNPVNIKVGANTWVFGADSSLNLPGPINNIIGGTITTGDYWGDPVYPQPVDLTKTINKLSDNTGSSYTLADGVEGQIMYLVPKNSATITGIYVVIANARILNSVTTSAAVFTDVWYYPFAEASTAWNNNIATLIFTDGAWNVSTGSFDY